MWTLGYPEAALADADHALEDAREMGHSATLMFALWGGRGVFCRSWEAAHSTQVWGLGNATDEGRLADLENTLRLIGLDEAPILTRPPRR